MCTWAFAKPFRRGRRFQFRFDLIGVCCCFLMFGLSSFSFHMERYHFFATANVACHPFVEAAWAVVRA